MATDAIEDDPAFRRDALEDRCLQRAAPWPPHLAELACELPGSLEYEPSSQRLRQHICARNRVARVSDRRCFTAEGVNLSQHHAKSSACVCECVLILCLTPEREPTLDEIEKRMQLAHPRLPLVGKQRRFVGNRCAGNGIHVVPTQPG